jgi:ATP-dependent DNA helicase RecG
MGRSKNRIYEMVLGDSSGKISAKFFRLPFRGYFDQFEIKQSVRVLGKPQLYRGRLEIHHPQVFAISSESDPALETEPILPIYPEIDFLTSAKIKKMIRSALASLEPLVDPLPPSIRQSLDLPDLQTCLEKIHQPHLSQNTAAEWQNRSTPFQRRLIFEDFFFMELILAARKAGLSKTKVTPLLAKKELIKPWLKSLPFELTGAQIRVVKEILQDLSSGHLMSRLVQGDVGSGKTLVALAACLRAIEAGGQAALMVPTEILAEQHYLGFHRQLTPLGVRVAFLSGSTQAKERTEILTQLALGEIDLLVGTHSLIEEPVRFKELSIVVIDEQHRFGVEQRGRLKEKGAGVHFLVMTATPIPRTLALTVYGDLDYSVIDELPPGRSPIRTRVVSQAKREQVVDFVKKQITYGRQVYWILPLIEESEKIDLRNAHDEFEWLLRQCPSLRIGLMHGRLSCEEKQRVMDRFKEGALQLLVSTTVVEVGVDVPNATVMVIENAERFGLAQLHQLRGRVGRGQHQSFCILILGHRASQESWDRVKFLETSTDGFEISEFDLELRGPGEFLGKRQSGMMSFRLANLLRDKAMLIHARREAFNLIKSDPQLSQKDHLALRRELTRTQGPAFWVEIA